MLERTSPANILMRTAFFAFSFALFGATVAFPTASTNTRTGSTGCPFAAGREKRQMGSPFDAVKQKIDVSGEHEFRPPGPNDQRGPCTGLNALANHGYISRSGVTTITEAASAGQKVFGLGLDPGIIFGTMAVAYVGKPSSEEFSIGGPVSSLREPTMSAPPPGLSATHNQMEGDASPTRKDAYMNNGDASSLSLEYFKHLYDLVPEGSSGTFDKEVMIRHRKWTREQSISTNPNYFVAPVSGLAVSTLTHLFIPAFLSNHSAEHPEGVLNHDNLKSFFAVSGSGQNLNYQKGHERIPDNWYRRPLTEDYTLPVIMSELVALFAKYPEFAALGGNTGKVNSFAGLDPDNLTEGIYNSANLLEGNNLMCFMLQAAQPGMTGVASDPALNLFKSKVGPIMGSLGCPEMSRFNTTAFDVYPGAKNTEAP